MSIGSSQRSDCYTSTHFFPPLLTSDCVCGRDCEFQCVPDQCGVQGGRPQWSNGGRQEVVGRPGVGGGAKPEGGVQVRLGVRCVCARARALGLAFDRGDHRVSVLSVSAHVVQYRLTHTVSGYTVSS